MMKHFIHLNIYHGQTFGGSGTDSGTTGSMGAGILGVWNTGCILDETVYCSAPYEGQFIIDNLSDMVF